MGSLDGFWAAVEQQLAELKEARNADDVLRILSRERNPYEQLPGHEGMVAGDGFFAGGGGDDSPMEALFEAGWSLIWAEASYHYAMRAPDGSAITYVEGDIYRGNQWPLARNAPCAYQGENHSEDRVTVYHGDEEPVVLCGFHAQEPIDFTKVRKEN